MAELYLIRHGQASFGADDYDRLSDLGHQQSVWLGEYFAERGLAFDHVVAGTMRRHRETLDSIARGMRASLSCETLSGLDEYDFHALYECLGEEHRELRMLARANKRDFYRGLKQVLQLWLDNRLSGPVPESWQGFQGRIATIRHDLQRHSAKRVLAVSSGGVIGAFTQRVLEAPDETAVSLTMQIQNSAISHYYFNADTFQLASFNNIPHLDQPGRLSFASYG